MKSGTTSLIHHLSHHKYIHAPTQEVHYFNKDVNFNKGGEWYVQKLLEGKTDEAKLIGEKTPTYSYQENVPQRIYEYSPNIKLIWVLRNPVDRCYSNYIHIYRKGGERLSFEEAVRSEQERIKENIFRGYKERGIYHKQVERFLEFFPLENMHFMLFEELVEKYDEKHKLNNLFEFLGLSAEGYSHKDEAQNVSIIPRFPFFTKKVTESKLSSLPLVNRSLKFINYYKKESGYPEMSEDLRFELLSFFKAHNDKLSKLIKMDLSLWEK